MYRLSDGLHAALRSGAPTLLVRLVSLWPDLTVRATFDLSRAVILSGSARADRRSGVRRTATLSVSNADGAMSPALSTDMLAEGASLRVEAGALVDGEPVLVPLLTGLVGPGTAASMVPATVDVSVSSHLSACQQDAGEALQLPAGMPLPDALLALWGPVLPFVAWQVSDEARGRALGSDVPVLPSDKRLDVGLRLAADLGCEAFDDREGAIVVRPRPDPMGLPTVREMAYPLTLRRSVVRPPVNAQAVSATPGDGDELWVVAEADDPASPVHRSRIGLRMAETVRSDAIADPATARATARAWLAGRSLAGDRVDATHGPEHMDLDPWDVVAWEEPVTRTSGRFVVDSVDVPLGPGAVAIGASQVVPMFLDEATAA